MSEELLRKVRIAAGTVLILSITAQIWLLPYYSAKRMTPAINNVADMTAALKTFVETVNRDYYDPKNPEMGFYWDIYQMLHNSASSSRTTEEFIADLRIAVLGGKDTRGVVHPGVFPLVADMLVSLRQTSDELRSDLKEITTAATETVHGTATTVQILNESLSHVSGISAELERQLREGGDIAGTFRELERAVGNFNTLVESEEVKTIMSESARTSHHFAESAKSVDIALQPWRKKASQLKMIMGKIVGLFRIVYKL